MMLAARTVMLAGLPFFGLAGARADVVVLSNGDRLTGEVEKLEAQKLAFKTVYAGTINIDWDNVKLLTTESQFEVEAETGARYRGSIQEEEGALQIVGADTPVPFVPALIVGLTPTSEKEPRGFWRNIDGTVDAGLSVTGGNSTLNQSSLGLRGNYRRQKYEWTGSLTSLFIEQDEADATSRQTADLRYDRFLSPRAFTFGALGFERNDRQRLNLRSRLGGGFGWKLVESARTEFSLLGGFTFTNEQFRDENSGAILPAASSGEGLAGIELETLRFDRIRVTTKLSIHPNLVQGGRYRVEYDSTLRVPVLMQLTWSLSLFDRFDSDPPVAVKRNDYGLVSAFGFSF